MVWMKVWEKSASIENNSNLFVTCTLPMSICKSMNMFEFEDHLIMKKKWFCMKNNKNLNRLSLAIDV